MSGSKAWCQVSRTITSARYSRTVTYHNIKQTQKKTTSEGTDGQETSAGVHRQTARQTCHQNCEFSKPLIFTQQHKPQQGRSEACSQLMQQPENLTLICSRPRGDVGQVKSWAQSAEHHACLSAARPGPCPWPVSSGCSSDPLMSVGTWSAVRGAVSSGLCVWTPPLDLNELSKLVGFLEDGDCVPCVPGNCP